MPRVTISYRRDDSLGVTGRIFDRLTGHYGRETVFRDIDNIGVGLDFRSQIRKALSETDVVVAVVGPKWLGPRSGHNRLMNGADPVRVEIETALRHEVPLIPILVSGAVMPSAENLPETLNSFAYRNALTVDSGKDFDVHMARLFDAITEILGVETATDARTLPPEPRIAKPDPDSVAPSSELGRVIAERDALRAERDDLFVQVEQLRKRESAFTMELNYAAEEAAVGQHEVDVAELTAQLEVSRRAFAKRMIAHNLVFASLTAFAVFLSFYAFLR
jgi:hypothetical protein